MEILSFYYVVSLWIFGLIGLASVILYSKYILSGRYKIVKNEEFEEMRVN